jgi:hypothetical protein
MQSQTSKVQFGAIDVASGKTVVINVITTASAADIAANANNRIHFCSASCGTLISH